MITQEPYKAARYMAIQYHGSQMYGDQSYLKHLEDTFNVLISFHVDDNIILIAAFLHDTLEDTTLTYSKIKDKFGIKVAELVYAITNELGRNRLERHNRTLPKVQADPKAIILKLSDRIANIKHGIETKNKEKFLMYKEEYPEFRNELYPYADNIGKEMFIYLDSLMNKFKE